MLIFLCWRYTLAYKPHAAPAPMMFGYDPFFKLSEDHLVRLIELVVESEIDTSCSKVSAGQPAHNPRLLIKVLLYGYATGVRSSRQLEILCNENLGYLFLTRGVTPSYRTICSFRAEQIELLRRVWKSLFKVADEMGLPRIGKITVDSSKFRADASTESVIKKEHFPAIYAEFAKIIEEARAVDEREDAEFTGQTQLGIKIDDNEHTRDIVRRVIGQSKDKPDNKKPRGRVTNKMLAILENSLQVIENAQKENLQHLCLTDPDARMMPDGCEKRIRECHNFEVAVDNGLIVAGQSTQIGPDNGRLEILVEAAKENEPNGITHVDADSGYYSGDAVGRLMEQGLDLCIPDSNTACDLHRDNPIGTSRGDYQNKVEMVYEAETDSYTCPEGNRLVFSQNRKSKGQIVKLYKAERVCKGCPLASICLQSDKTRYRTIQVGEHREILIANRKRFEDPEHVERYRGRANSVETVFAFIRRVLGYRRWSLRGKRGVAAEAELFKAGYQLRKIHSAQKKVKAQLKSI